MTYQILMHTILIAPRLNVYLIIVKGSFDFKHLAPKQEMQSSGGKSCFTCNKLHRFPYHLWSHDGSWILPSTYFAF